MPLHEHELLHRILEAGRGEHGPALLRLSTMLTEGDRHRAEDIVQETMLRAWTHRAKLDIQHYSTRAWLITVARHLAVDAHRARQSRPAEAELDDQLALDRLITSYKISESARTASWNSGRQLALIAQRALSSVAGSAYLDTVVALGTSGNQAVVDGVVQRCLGIGRARPCAGFLRRCGLRRPVRQ